MLIQNRNGKSQTLKIAGLLYTKRLDDRFFVFNPRSSKGVIVLNNEAFDVLRRIDNTCSDNLFQELKSIDTDYMQAEFDKLISEFREDCLIEFEHDIEKQISKSRTLGVWMQLTNRCNLACPYCYIAKNSLKMPVEIGKKAIEKIFCSSKKNEISKINLKFAGGEPSLEQDNLFEFADYADLMSTIYRIPVRKVMITNGTLLNDALIQRLKDKSFHVAISIDGLEKTHDRTRKYKDGQGSFKVVSKNLMKLLESNLDFNVSVVINSYNLKELPELTRFFLKYRIRFTFNFIRDNPQISDSQVIPNEDELIRYMKKTYKIIRANLPDYPVCDAILDKIQFKPRLMPCGAGDRYVVVSVDGKLSNCQVLLDHPVTDINNEEDIIARLREKSIVPSRPIIEETTGCKDCLWKYLCSSGCPILREKVSGTYLAKSPYCKVYKALIPEVLELEALRILEGEKNGIQKS